MKKTTVLNIFFGSILGMIFIFIAYYAVKYETRAINSDYSAEMILADMLAKENKLISSNWYYSSELRVLHTQLVTMPLFKIFSDWNTVRILSMLITNILLVVAYFRFIRLFDIRERWIQYLSAFCMITPLSLVYLDIINVGMFYIPHLIMGLVYFNLLFTIIKSEKPIQKHKVRLGIFLVLSLICGLSGVRYILVFQIPMVCSVGVLFLLKNPAIRNYKGKDGGLIEWNACEYRKEFLVGVAGMFLAGTGYILNTFVIRKFIRFAVFGNIMFTTDNDHIYKVFAGLFSLLGYSNDIRMLSVKGILNLLVLLLVCVFIYVIAVIYKKYFKKGTIEGIMCMTLISSFAVNTILYCTTDEYTSRFYIPVIFWIVPCIAVYLNSEKRLLYRYGVVAIVFVTYLAAGVSAVKDMSKIDLNSNKSGYINYLEDHDLDYGYSTYWNGDVTTELTNGKIQIANVVKIETMEPYYFLTQKKFFENKDYKADQPTFILMSADEYAACKDCQVLQNGRKAYYDDAYVVYTFRNRAVLDRFAQ